MTTPIVIAVAWAVLLGLVGGLLTTIGAWYRDLAKPSWQPPDWLFGPAWTVILGLAAWAFVLCWNAIEAGAGTVWGGAGDRTVLIVLYAINFVGHLLWSPLFFKLRRPDWALIEVPFLWASVLSLCVVLREWSVLASWLIVPYFVWVSFAWILNWTIVRLNRPFGG